MEDESENYTQVGDLEFRGSKYEVEMSVQNGEVLEILVENCDSYEQWNGKYDVSYIEELSHKTGNFKHFGIFCSMLESAILKNSESVSLDLLTYDDLKILREQKLGENRPRKLHKHNDAKLNGKRYLIMTYTVEFDQIHYPLPLTYTGSSDPATLKNQIRELKQEIQELKTDRISTHGKSYEVLTSENKQLKKELASLHSRTKDLNTGNLSKELKVLKKVVQNLENDLLKERNKHQRQMAKKKQEYDDLIEEFEELKSTERNFRVRCKSLSDELTILKRNSRLSPAVNTQTLRQNTSNTKRNTPINRDRTYSNNPTVNRGRSKARSVSRERSVSSSSIGRTPSPGGFRRFNPSAYIQERNQKRHEAETSKNRRRTPTSNTKRTPIHGHYSKPPSGGRSSSKNKPYRNSSVDSDADSVSRLKQAKNSSANRSANRRRVKLVRSDTSDDEKYRSRAPKARVTLIKKSKSPLKSYSRDDEDESENHSIGIAEIDARLEALQKFMKNNMD